jgi:hypothetical protein
MSSLPTRADEHLLFHQLVLMSSPLSHLRSLILTTVPVRSPSAGNRSDWLAFEQEQLKEELDLRRSKGEFVDPDFFASCVADLRPTCPSLSKVEPLVLTILIAD